MRANACRVPAMAILKAIVSSGWAAAGFLLMGCNFAAIEKCHEQMKSSQQVMNDMDRTPELEQVEAALLAVSRAHASCQSANRSDEVSKISEAKRRLEAQLKAMKAQAARPKKPKLTEAELVALEKKGDPSCPRGQQYEHHQDKRMIKCTGAQLVEMNWKQATSYFDNRGFAAHARGAVLRFEEGAKVYEFSFDKSESTSAPLCLTIVADPGIPWEEVVARTTGAHPARLKLSKPVSTKRGPLALLVEGSSAQYTVKLGKCEATPGQKPVKSLP